jgi:sugar lactone lactonase YvrE
VSDWGNHRVMKWVEGAKQGIVVAGGQGEGNGRTQVSYPNGVVVDQLGTVYVAEEQNDRIIRWLKGATQGSVIVGGNGRGGQSNQLCVPICLSFDRHGNLYVADWGNARVQKFNIDIGKKLHIELGTFFKTKFVQKLTCLPVRLVTASLVSLNKSYEKILSLYIGDFTENLMTCF